MPLAQNGNATRLGRNWGNGIVRGVRPLMFVRDTGFRDVDSNATWIPGQFVTLNSAGKLTAFSAAADKRVGIAKTAKGAPFYLPAQEEAEWVPVGETITLSKANVKDVAIYTAAGALLTVTTTYTVNETNGVITVVSENDTPDVTPNSPAAGAFVTIRYQYKDMDHAPFDQTLASGKAAIFEDNGEYAFEVYDTSASYAVGNYVKLTTAGVLTIEATPGTATAETVGFVTRAPSADDVTLGVKITCF